MARSSKHKQPQNMSPRIENRRARHDYAITEKLETGIKLTGTEVKSIRMSRVSIAEGFARIERDGQLFLHNVQIEPYPHAAASFQHEPKRARKLLAHKREIAKLAGLTTAQGTTLIPLAIYFHHGRVKVEIGVATGKKKHDKRSDIKQRDAERQMRRAMTRKHL